MTSLELLRAGLHLHERYRIAWYDALIVVAAQEAHLTILYSEDFHHGQEFGPLHIENPFR